MDAEQHKSPLEKLYEDDAWRQEIKVEKLARLTKRLWLMVLGLVIVGANAVLVIAGDTEIEHILKSLWSYILILVAFGSMAGIPAVILAFIPIKPYKFGDRLELGFLVLFIVFGVLLAILLFWKSNLPFL